MCVGESYTFALYAESGALCSADYFLPTDDNSHLIVNDYYDLQFSDYYFPIAMEIAQLFTAENQQEYRAVPQLLTQLRPVQHHQRYRLRLCLNWIVLFWTH